jgi:hypothetical protein
MSVYGPFNSGAAVGGAGVATVNSTTGSPVDGIIYGVCVKYNDACPATTDVVIATSGSAAPAFTLLTLTDKNTDGWFWPRITTQNLLGVDVANTNSDFPMISDNVKVTVTGANAGDSVDVWLLVVN